MKSFGQWINESLSAEEKEAMLYLASVGLLSDEQRIEIQLADEARSRPEGKVELDFRELDLPWKVKVELEEALHRRIMSQLLHLSSAEILELTGHGFESDETADSELEDLQDQLGLDPDLCTIDREGTVRISAKFYSRGGGDLGFGALLPDEGYPLAELLEDDELRLEFLKGLLETVLDGGDLEPY